MTIDDKFEDEKLQYNIDRKTEKYNFHYQEKLKYMNILQVRKYYILIKIK